MGQFTIAYKKTMGIEGGYANNPNDSGGMTYKGISRKNNPNWGGWSIVDTLSKQPNFPKNLSASAPLESMVLDIYKKQYWDIYKLDQVNSQDICNEIFDTGVNMGTGTASKFLQRGLNIIKPLTVDGIIGSATVSAVNALGTSGTNLLLKLLNVLQGSHYIDIIEKNPTQREFANSWFSRVDL